MDVTESHSELPTEDSQWHSLFFSFVAHWPSEGNESIQSCAAEQKDFCRKKVELSPDISGVDPPTISSCETEMGPKLEPEKTPHPKFKSNSTTQIWIWSWIWFWSWPKQSAEVRQRWDWSWSQSGPPPPQWAKVRHKWEQSWSWSGP